MVSTRAATPPHGSSTASKIGLYPPRRPRVWLETGKHWYRAWLGLALLSSCATAFWLALLLEKRFVFVDVDSYFELTSPSSLSDRNVAALCPKTRLRNARQRPAP